LIGTFRLVPQNIEIGGDNYRQLLRKKKKASSLTGQ